MPNRVRRLDKGGNVGRAAVTIGWLACVCVSGGYNLSRESWTNSLVSDNKRNDERASENGNVTERREGSGEGTHRQAACTGTVNLSSGQSLFLFPLTGCHGMMSVRDSFLLGPGHSMSSAVITSNGNMSPFPSLPRKGRACRPPCKQAFGMRTVSRYPHSTGSLLGGRVRLGCWTA
jgi:hypothetical protein